MTAYRTIIADCLWTPAVNARPHYFLPESAL